MINVTDKEYSVLRSILTNCFSPMNYDIGEAEDHVGKYIWSDSIDDAREPCGIQGRALSAIVSSLNSKNLVVSDGQGRDAGVCLTQLGYDVAIREHSA